MSRVIVPDGYRPTLGLYDTQTAIGMLKRIFEEKLCYVLNLKRVSAPLFVDPNTGLNDDLNGVLISKKRAGMPSSSIRWRNGSAWRCIPTDFPRARVSIPT